MTLNKKITTEGSYGERTCERMKKEWVHKRTHT
jgi:hypothetical protein